MQKAQGSSTAERAGDYIDPWYLENLVCPLDQSVLMFLERRLLCRNRHAYPVVDGVPIMLVDDARETLNVMSATLSRANTSSGLVGTDNLYLETLGINDDERRGILKLARTGTNSVDPVVSYLVAATNGLMYRHTLGTLATYPIPNLPLPEGHGQNLLDIGCSWGRWCIAAARRGYRPVGLDPSLGAILAARRVAEQLGVSARFVVGDGRCLPFAKGFFSTVFSYSVIQHFSYEDARQTISEASRVLKPNGSCLLQLPNAFGLRCLYHQFRRHFRQPVGFEVRYWKPRQLMATFKSLIGNTTLSPDCYFGIGLQASDLDLMPFWKRNLIGASESFKALSRVFGVLTYCADSLWVRARRSD